MAFGRCQIRSLSNAWEFQQKQFINIFENKEDFLEQVLHLYHNEQYEMLENLWEEQNPACLFFDVWQIAMETENKTNKVFYDDLHYYYPELEKKVEKAIRKKFEQFFFLLFKEV